MTDQPKITTNSSAHALPTITSNSSAHMLMDPAKFEQLYRVGRMLCSTPLWPESLRKGTPEQQAATAALVMNIALRLNEDPLTVAQNIYFVGAKPGWSTSYLIAKANQHGVFKEPINWEVTGEGDELSVTAFARVAGSGSRVEYTCDMEMAKAEGWTKNAKYKSMPKLMLRYRSAAALIRLYCPEVMVGVPAQIEVELGQEMRDVTPDTERAPVTETKAATSAKKEAEEIVEAEPAKEEPVADVVEADDPETADEPDEAEAEPETVAADEKAEPQGKPAATPDPEQFKALANMIERDLDDAPSVEDVLDLYGPQIEQMKTAAPEIHKSLTETIEAYRKDQAAKSDGGDDAQS